MLQLKNPLFLLFRGVYTLYILHLFAIVYIPLFLSILILPFYGFFHTTFFFYLPQNHKILGAFLFFYPSRLIKEKTNKKIILWFT